MMIIVVGDPMSGFEFFGPFEDDLVALEYGRKHIFGTNWWMADLYKEIDKPIKADRIGVIDKNLGD